MPTKGRSPDVKVTLQVPTDLYKRAMEESRRDDRSFAATVRVLLRRYVEEREKPPA